MGETPSNSGDRAPTSDSPPSASGSKERSGNKKKRSSSKDHSGSNTATASDGNSPPDVAPASTGAPPVADKAHDLIQRVLRPLQAKVFEKDDMDKLDALADAAVKARPALEGQVPPTRVDAPPYHLPSPNTMFVGVPATTADLSNGSFLRGGYGGVECLLGVESLSEEDVQFLAKLLSPDVDIRREILTPLADTLELDSYESCSDTANDNALDVFDTDHFMEALQTEKLFGPLEADDVNLCKEPFHDEDEVDDGEDALDVPLADHSDYESDVDSDEDFEDDSDAFQQDYVAMRTLGDSGWKIYDELHCGKL
ncbi:hypothetical protein PHPALM_6887 [Phytophthora palmivora]|uniref:Uncharacterized protein n=1 Tax=Phytophthora palmivora TaxID=4796 RepID=A0A2P4YDR5_9STRA|nr:hypothetical protein PHPALM_6887 [Phytophthora palmivora]